MEELNYNAQTKETTIIDAPTIAIFVVEDVSPTEADRLSALESSMLEMILGGSV